MIFLKKKSLYYSINNLLVVVFLSITLCACASKIQRAMKEYEDESQNCYIKKKSGEIKTYLKLTECKKNLLVTKLSNVNYPYMDLVEERMSEELKLSKKIDNHELSASEAESMIQDLERKFLEKQKERDAAAAMLVKRRNADRTICAAQAQSFYPDCDQRSDYSGYLNNESVHGTITTNSCGGFYGGYALGLERNNYISACMTQKGWE